MPYTRAELRDFASRLKRHYSTGKAKVRDVHVAELANGELKVVISMGGDEPDRYGAMTVDQVRSLGHDAP